MNARDSKGREQAAERLKSAHVLIVEDSMIIGLDLEETLTGFGVGRVTLVATAAEAIETIDAGTVTVALLDLGLEGNTTSLPAAEALRASNVPFAFLTGYTDPAGIPAHLAAAPIFGKPVSTTKLRNGILSLLAETAGT